MLETAAGTTIRHSPVGRQDGIWFDESFASVAEGQIAVPYDARDCDAGGRDGRSAPTVGVMYFYPVEPDCTKGADAAALSRRELSTKCRNLLFALGHRYARAV